MTVPQRLHALREEKGMTCEEVAKRIGTTRQTMSRYETGAIAKIEYEKIVALARLYDVHPGYIMGWCERDGSNKVRDDVSPDRKKLIEFIEQLPADQMDLYLTLFSLPTERLQAIVDLLR